MFVKKVAEREKVKLMIGLTGPSGAGKTYSALQLAYGLTKDWKKITLADTENGSALYYAGNTGEWGHIDFPPHMRNGYHPDNWCALIDYVESDPTCEVLILDSISHEWNGVGGTLELHNRAGGRFDSWAKVTPIHNRFIDKMRNSRLHIIATMRAKQDYVLEQNDKGKSAPVKVGLASVQREGLDYEFGVMFDINIKHFAESSKDRTGLFSEMGAFQISQDIGDMLLQWVNSGKPKVLDKDNQELLLRLRTWLERKQAIDFFDIMFEKLEGREINKNILEETLEEIKKQSVIEG